MRSLICLAMPVVAVVATACSESTGNNNPPQGACSTTTPVTLSELQGTTVAMDGAAQCASLPADGSTYLVVPQLPTADEIGVVNFEIGTQTGTTARVVASRVSEALPRFAAGPTMQEQLEHRLRSMERQLAAQAHSNPPVTAERQLQAAAPAPPTRVFHVLSSFTGSNTFTDDTANLKYEGTNVLIYQSKNALAAPQGFSDAQITAFGNTFDKDLYAIDTATFGEPTDIDANGHVIVLLSPIINKLTPASVCATSGFIAGFFFALDLEAGQPDSNDGELFYALVPDPNGTFSCAHSVDRVGQITPATFIHEFQHMISFGQHVLIHHGAGEDPWLNEGLSHIAEELGSRFYEHKFPPPTGRTDPAQLFPDSSQGFIGGDLSNSYSYLSNTTSIVNDTASVSAWPSDGTLSERGAIWLFLRWAGDLEDSTLYGRLDQTNLTGVPNFENAAAETFPAAFGDFSMALYTDSLVGVDRSLIPDRLRFHSRNLRQIYQRIFDTSQGTSNPLPRAFPIVLKPLSASQTLLGSMWAGTMDFYKVTVPTSGNAVLVHFAQQGGAAFGTGFNAQVSLFKCPAAHPEACQ